jgi:hypothetical protein
MPNEPVVPGSNPGEGKAIKAPVAQLVEHRNYASCIFFMIPFILSIIERTKN